MGVSPTWLWPLGGGLSLVPRASSGPGPSCQEWKEPALQEEPGEPWDPWDGERDGFN